jgi:hypothetical protein
MEEQDPWPLGLTQIETARDRDLVPDSNGEVKSVVRTGGEIPPRIKEIP